jgi:8-oxo-dGTP pyrophosphatase MutT (NUDIX family)
VTKRERGVVLDEGDGIDVAVVPKDAATLVIIDRSSNEPKVLLGRRHPRHKFMPGKFVFPGGRLDAADGLMPVAKPLHPAVEHKLLAHIQTPAIEFVRALALAAIRETFEETGLVIGAKGSLVGQVSSNKVPAGTWTEFMQTGYYPDLSKLQLIARAITPPGFPRRFDARFFSVDATAIVHRKADVNHAESELTELTWLSVAAAQSLDLPVITGMVLQELKERLTAGFSPELPVPFSCHGRDDFSFERIV